MMSSTLVTPLLWTAALGSGLMAGFYFAYTDTFHGIERNPNNELKVVDNNGELIEVLQLTFIPYLTHTGSWHCLI